jgi:hypothetical protein
MKSLLALAFLLASGDDVGTVGGLAECVGDCSGDGTIAVNEVITGVNIALGNALLSICPAFDRDGDGMVGINELIASVGGVLDGCTPAGGGLRLEPVGGEFPVSAGTIGLRAYSQVAIDASGGFVVAWEATQTYDDNFGLAARRFRSDGTPATPVDFAVNTFTVDAQRTQDVAMRPDGSFLAVWETSGIFLEDADPLAGIYGRRFDSGGVPLGPDFKINTFNEFREDEPSAATLPNGGYIVVWTVHENKIAGSVEVLGQRLDAAGQLLGEEFSVNAYTTGPQNRPAVAALPGGGFVVVWQDGYRDGLDVGIFGQRFDSGAGRVGTEFLVNTYTFSQQRHPAVAAAADGSFLVTWGGILVGDEQIIARHFDSAGEPIGTEFQVNAEGELGQQAYSSVAAEPQGGFFVVWMSGGSIGPFNVFAQRIDRAGARMGAEFRVNTTTSNLFPRAFPEVAVNAAGDVVVAWEEQAQDGVPIRGQRYRLVEE